MNKFALKLFKVKEEKLICFSKYTCQCFGIFFLKGCYFKASILYLIHTLKENLIETHLHSQWLYWTWLNCHFHMIYMDLVDLLEESWMERQPKNTNSTTDLQAEIPALVDPLYQSDWKLQEDTQYYQTLSDCVNTTHKNKLYWTRSGFMEPSTWKKYSLCQSNPPPILNQPLLPWDELFFHVCNAFKHK